jgi:hypothetical protein
MTSDDMLEKLINHEMLIEEANHVKNLSKGITTFRKQDIAFKASKKDKRKKVVEESSTEKDDDDDDDDDDDGDESTKCDTDEMTLFIRRFSKMMSKKNSSKETRKTS